MAETDIETVVREPEQRDAESHVRSYFAAIGRRDAKGMADHWREDGIEEILPVGIMRGRAEIQGFFDNTFSAIPDLETTVKRVVTQGDKVAVEWRMEGHHTGTQFQGIDATGKRIEMRGFDLLEVEDGLIVSNTAYFDGMSLARQFGLMPPMDSAAEKAMKAAFNALTKARKAIADRRDA